MIHLEIKFTENAERQGNRAAEHKLDTREGNVYNWEND